MKNSVRVTWCKEKITTFEAFFEASYDMTNIFGNMVYLNVKERDRF